MPRLIIVRCLQSLGLVLVAHLFICLINASLGQTPLSLTLPSLIDPDSNSTVELLLFTLPAQLLFLLATRCVHRLGSLNGVFALIGTMTALVQCLVFAEAFGNTWSATEIVGLLGFNLHYLLLAMIPGLSLLMALERWPGPRLAA